MYSIKIYAKRAFILWWFFTVASAVPVCLFTLLLLLPLSLSFLLLLLLILFLLHHREKIESFDKFILHLEIDEMMLKQY